MWGGWGRYHLTQHPEVMQKVERELDEAGLLATASRPSPRRLEYSDLSRLTYLSWVLKVCLPLPSHIRTASCSANGDLNVCSALSPDSCQQQLHSGL